MMLSGGTLRAPSCTPVIDTVRTIVARLIVTRLGQPRAAVVHAWLWLAAKSDNLEEKRLCLNRVLELDPDNEAATWALILLDRKRPEN